MKKSTKSAKTPATPQAKKTVSKKTVGTKKAVAKKAPAPAAKVVPAPVKKAPVKKAAAPKKAATVKKVAVKKAVVKKTVAPKQATVSATVISARIDIGFGHALFIRGEGPGLSWDAGTPLNCVADDQWTIALTGATSPVVFKFLVDDLSWSAGEDYVVEPGSEVSLVPSF
ncbi:hypothetical protein [Synoicihabitans lomoniglobus]|uniref:CBM20 domain-containing protein n=1 Tax=Synoicihabitans lomoniglobus TaxID=2909285 RepID=A0AAF0CNX4_9BACT|nr:hypothetical protein [Opitutaceae bacterium LMO-M01]WED63049.1 hypothetical protein PXH66_11970 [Opitutaceae bacterium LMO-M01]